MSFQQSKRMANVQSPMIPVVSEWIASCPGTISLAQGVVHYGSPDSVRTAAARAVSSPDASCSLQVDRYSLVRGLDSLLSVLNEKGRRENGIDTSRQTCVVTAGANMGFLNAVLAIADQGDEIILLTPYYFNHEMAIEMAGCKPVSVPTDQNYHPDLNAIKAAITPKTRGIVTISPNNPTGVVYSRETLAAVNRLCHKKGIYHISDEAYEYFVYDGLPHTSPGGFPDAEQHTISLFSLSKAYAMAGWRSGYMFVPQHLETAVKKVQDTNLICPPVVTQLASEAALREGKTWCEKRIAPFSRVRDIVVSELAELGERCRLATPSGAFYAFVDLQTNKPDLEIVEALVKRFGVGVMPGSTFGMTDGCRLRIAYGALDADSVAEGMGRLKRGLDSLLSE